MSLNSFFRPVYRKQDITSPGLNTDENLSGALGELGYSPMDNFNSRFEKRDGNEFKGNHSEDDRFMTRLKGIIK